MRRSPLAFLATVVLALGVLALGAATGRADIPGVVYNASNGHYYKLYSTATTWTAAKSNAEALGGYLATITSQAENTWVQSNVGTSSAPWIGGTDETVEGTWVWVTGETWSWTNWGPGEPNNVGNEDHLQFRSDGMWNDVPAANSYPYIVEWNTDPNGPPEAPTNLRATAASDALVNLAWNDASSRETGFEMERAVGAGAFAAFATPAANATSQADATVAAETTYSYRIRSVGSAGNSEWSNVATVTTPPPTVTGLTATLVTSTNVRLDWTNVAQTATGIEIERGVGTPGSAYFVRGSVGAAATSYLDTTAVPETTLAYRVRVVGPGGRSRYSQEAYVTTPPASPSGLSLTVVSDTRVVLGWTDNSTIETGYEIERGVGTAPSVFTSVASLPENYRAYTDDGVAPETTYTYRVRARNDSGNSDWSASGQVTTAPRTPATVSAEPASATRMRVTWADVSVRELGFEIERAVGEDGVFAHLVAVGRGVHEHVDATARQEVVYRYRVAAFSNEGTSNWSESAPVRMPAVLVVKGLSVTPSRGGRPAKAPPRILVVGEFDAGSGADLLQPSSFSLGDESVALPVGVAKGRTIRAEADGARLDLRPAGTTSRVALRFQAPAAAFAALEAEGTVTVAWTCGSFRAIGSVRLSGGAFQPPARGSLVDPACELTSLTASVPPGDSDAFTLKAVFDASAGAPEVPPQVIVRCGSAVFVSDPREFVRSGSRFVLKQKVGGGTRSVTLDYAKGTAKVTVRGAVDVGVVAKGSVPLPVELTIGDAAWADTLTVKSTGRSLRY